MNTTTNDVAEMTDEEFVALRKYARETAADTGEDYETAVRMMGDEPGAVAEAIGCTVGAVMEFTAAGG